MNLREKIGQLFILGFSGLSIDDSGWVVEQIERDALGGVILFDKDLHHPGAPKNIESLEQVEHLLSSLKQVTEQGHKKWNRSPLPLICSVDCEGGHVNRLSAVEGFPICPSAQSVAECSDEEVWSIACTMASSLYRVGFNVNFAPVLDVNINPTNPILGALDRCFSANPAVVAHCASIFVKAFRSEGIEPVYKHFPGHGSSSRDSHLGFVDVTESWQNSELEPYRQLLKDDPMSPMMMTAHLIHRGLDATGVPATLSRPILTDLLRCELGFQGVIVTDDMQMKAIADHYGLDESLCLAMNAGADMFIFGNQLSEKYQSVFELVNLIENSVKLKRIPLERVEEAYRRVVAFKKRIGSRGLR